MGGSRRRYAFPESVARPQRAAACNPARRVLLRSVIFTSDRALICALGQKPPIATGPGDFRFTSKSRRSRSSCRPSAMSGQKRLSLYCEIKSASNRPIRVSCKSDRLFFMSCLCGPSLLFGKGIQERTKPLPYLVGLVDVFATEMQCENAPSGSGRIRNRAVRSLDRDFLASENQRAFRRIL